MEIRKTLRNGMILMALSMPVFSAGCSNAIPLAEQNQVLIQEKKCLQLEEKLKDAEGKLEEKTRDYFSLEKEKRTIADEKDKLERERGEYPRNTPEDVVRENKTLRTQLLKNDITSSVGYRILVDKLEYIRKLTIENFGLKRENQNARTYLERQGIYLSEIDGKEIDETESPLYIERKEHDATRNRLRLERAERDADKYFYEAQNTKIGMELRQTLDSFERLSQDLQRAVRDRDLYKKGYEQWKNYAKSLENPKPSSVR